MRRKISWATVPFVVRTTDVQLPCVIVAVLRTAICASMTSPAATPAGTGTAIDVTLPAVAVAEARKVIDGSTT